MGADEVTTVVICLFAFLPLTSCQSFPDRGEATGLSCGMAFDSESIGRLVRASCVFASTEIADGIAFVSTLSQTYVDSFASDCCFALLSAGSFGFVELCFGAIGNLTSCSVARALSYPGI